MIIYSPALNAWAAYGPAGNIIRWGPASSGQNWCPDLESGDPVVFQLSFLNRMGGGCTHAVLYVL